ncbi:hypothetical protein KIL84_000049 [Mauremys mutica]|uniref:Uncharacterized protein n=1 Tax=Mauremys mutica TaxID=74926 RepID=A0A9D3XG34_9SAUR|nr:hypothetical protein KIL84_000049 [Mauremys mutica]
MVGVPGQGWALGRASLRPAAVGCSTVSSGTPPAMDGQALRWEPSKQKGAESPPSPACPIHAGHPAELAPCPALPATCVWVPAGEVPLSSSLALGTPLSLLPGQACYRTRILVALGAACRLQVLGPLVLYLSLSNKRCIL